MSPASRTPEGELNQCPICGHEVRLEPSRPPGDAPCPYCGHLLWFSSSKHSDAPSLQDVTDVFTAWTQVIARAPDDRYYEKLLFELVKLMAARAGAVWIPTGKALKLKCQYQDAEFSRASSDKERRERLLREVVTSGQSAFGPSSVDQGTNENVVLAVPVKRNQEIKAIIEIIQGPGASGEVRHGNLRFLERICECANDRICALAETAAKKRWWEVWKK